MTRSRTRLPRYLSRRFVPKDTSESPLPTALRRVPPPTRAPCHRRSFSDLDDLEQGSYTLQPFQREWCLQKTNWIRPRWLRLFIQLCLPQNDDSEHYRIEGKFADPDGSKYID
ncbi:hypothetical protein FVEN_g12894 [Fusarium venenatum]|uniref:Uncharacterized protein n=1 Tax=Fusarium venenatum TaxID=56646 RepID=A0A2L2TYD7_9HYPO|nr:uncharacterized protein FVRRES_02457 [Fusarium venenatum]KAG8354658.1 hypothetical protein FVEN_g12894 [Fusarium venenatum]CEI65945.1 unnamed protein product [Fusarium venenatum]